MSLRKKQSQSPLDQSKVQQFVREYLDESPFVSNHDIAAEVHAEFGIETSERSVGRAIKRWGVERPKGFERPGQTIGENEATIVGAPSQKAPDWEAFMIENGFSPDEWEVNTSTINKWEGPSSDGGGREYRQLKLNLRRKLSVDFPRPADRIEGDLVVSRHKVVVPTDRKLVVFTGDQQAPFFDPSLHEKFVQWLEENKPEEGILIGDTVDFPDISRHRLDPENNATVQECINSGYAVLRDYVKASPETRWTKLAGNHDERIRNTMLDLAEKMYNVKQAEIDGDGLQPSVLSIRHLLRLDELGIEYIEPNGEYAQCQVNISPYLAARHGWLAAKGSGSSALKTLEHLGYSIVVGHTHRQGHVHKTTHDINGDPTTLTAVETGCMCRIEGGLGYAVAPDWQNGFATATVYGDGKFKMDLATYVSNTLMWRDQRY